MYVVCLIAYVQIASQICTRCTCSITIHKVGGTVECRIGPSIPTEQVDRTSRSNVQSGTIGDRVRSYFPSRIGRIFRRESVVFSCAKRTVRPQWTIERTVQEEPVIRQKLEFRRNADATPRSISSVFNTCMRMSMRALSFKFEYAHTSKNYISIGSVVLSCSIVLVVEWTHVDERLTSVCKHLLFGFGGPTPPRAHRDCTSKHFSHSLCLRQWAQSTWRCSRRVLGVGRDSGNIVRLFHFNRYAVSNRVENSRTENASNSWMSLHQIPAFDLIGSWVQSISGTSNSVSFW